MQTHYGHLWLGRIFAGAVLAVMLAASRGAVLLWSGSALSALLLATLAGMGHAGSGQGLAGAAHLGIDAAHLLAAGAWLGALVPFVFVARAAARGDDAQRRFAAQATKRFSTLGVASMAVIAVSGVANSCYMLPTLSALVSSPYGRWLYAKIVLFLVILIIAATNRLQLTPRLVPAAASGPAFRELTRNALAECLLGFSIVALVGELGITVPGHMQ